MSVLPSRWAPSIYAFDPIQISFSLPHEKPIGEPYRIVGSSCSKPRLSLADFQVDVTVSMRPPPAQSIVRSLRIGMTREAVIWSRGYPWEIGERSTLLHLAKWTYGVGVSVLTVSFSREDFVTFGATR